MYSLYFKYLYDTANIARGTNVINSCFVCHAVLVAVIININAYDKWSICFDSRIQNVCVGLIGLCCGLSVGHGNIQLPLWVSQRLAWSSLWNFCPDLWRSALQTWWDLYWHLPGLHLQVPSRVQWHWLWTPDRWMCIVTVQKQRQLCRWYQRLWMHLSHRI